MTVLPLANKSQGPEIHTAIIKVSSRTASMWLDTYRGPNRKINETKVIQYQSDMEAGRWQFDASPIRFGEDGLLLDGQHRLTALANAVPELELEFLVVQGLTRESQMVMDQPQVRTVGQNLSLRGVKHSTTVASATKVYLDWTKGRLFKSVQRGSTTKPEQEQWAMEHADLFEKLFQTDMMKIDAPSSVLGAFGLAVMQTSPVRAHRFFHLLATGVGMQEGDPILALDRRLRNIRRSGVKVSAREYLAYFIRAWNAWVTNTKLQKLQHSRFGVTEENFPAILPVKDLAAV